MSHGLVYAKRGFTSPGSTFLRSVARLGATDAWDFVSSSYMRDGRVTSDPGLTVTRASVGTAQTADGRIITFGSGVRRQTDKGLLIEGARTNLFLNSAVGETQSITVTAAAHTLSFYGTGTVILSGVSTDGPLVGTGEFDRVSLTFTPTAGSLTLTVSGDIKWVNLELGSFPSSWIPTEGAAVTRAADFATATLSGVNYPLSMMVEFSRSSDAGASEYLLATSDGTGGQEAASIINASGLWANTINATTQQMNISAGSAIALATISKGAFRVKTNDSRGAINAELGTQDTSVTLPSAPNVVAFGSRPTFALFSFSYIRRAALAYTPWTDATLQAVTT